VRLKYVDPTVPGVAGRLDFWLIPFPPGASYSVTVPARNFVLTPSLSEWPFLAAPAELQMRLTTAPNEKPNLDVLGLGLIHVWVGTLTSEWVRFPECLQ
jgi:hypothetical protein